MTSSISGTKRNRIFVNINSGGIFCNRSKIQIQDKLNIYRAKMTRGEGLKVPNGKGETTVNGYR